MTREKPEDRANNSNQNIEYKKGGEMSAKIQRKQLKSDTRQRRKQKTQRNNPLIYTQNKQNKKGGKIMGKTISRIILGVHTAEKITERTH